MEVLIVIDEKVIAFLIPVMWDTDDQLLQPILFSGGLWLPFLILIK